MQENRLNSHLQRKLKDGPSSKGSTDQVFVVQAERRRERAHDEGGIMEEEMIKDVAHTFGRGSLDMRRIILHRRWSERSSGERGCWDNKRASSSDANQVAERSN
jgi:hypothetical protein